ncbi:hypothetical protein [Paraclostridium sordellii]|uniref:hypothetical protein n=1 Tax=Paraclostridium sordellii TaxID=1505 RepID=UPI0005DD93D7|nr:hypothetical protein [Paeniclostridium sordellii]CEN26497.1 Uncharacterised protein [[Clostridium] sordellii] [Paeniclostridium sordellii]
MMYETFNDVNHKYLKEIEILVKKKISINSKKLNIIKIEEEYFNDTNECMPYDLILPLTDWFLEEILKSKDVDKSSKSEYPILSYHQIKRRNKKYLSVTDDILDYLYHPKSDNSRNGKKK